MMVSERLYDYVDLTINSGVSVLNGAHGKVQMWAPFNNLTLKRPDVLPITIT